MSETVNHIAFTLLSIPIPKQISHIKSLFPFTKSTPGILILLCAVGFKGQPTIKYYLSNSIWQISQFQATSKQMTEII
ncbi:hypothetical protein BpHYR1_042357 [Brachionus plicatilis]|uniref:Uncharacterized protein n=1 Tax=Brachionus plicatilis TaxID=10195 RepID=A0A3M7SUI1_BRAPC|nr:hypothetical protein BpHYR1_042357 [Brachionus plicatilis]